MSEISDELRKCADTYDDKVFFPKLNGRYHALADRIDAEMVEWPLLADKKPVKPSQTVYDTCGGEWEVTGITFTPLPGVALVALEHDGTELTLFSGDLTHERPDSLGRISQELEDMSEHFRATDKESFLALLDFAERIRRLAEKEASNGTD